MPKRYFLFTIALFLLNFAIVEDVVSNTKVVECFASDDKNVVTNDKKEMENDPCLKIVGIKAETSKEVAKDVAIKAFEQIILKNNVSPEEMDCYVDFEKMTNFVFNKRLDKASLEERERITNAYKKFLSEGPIKELQWYIADNDFRYSFDDRVIEASQKTSSSREFIVPMTIVDNNNDTEYKIAYRVIENNDSYPKIYDIVLDATSALITQKQSIDYLIRRAKNVDEIIDLLNKEYSVPNSNDR